MFSPTPGRSATTGMPSGDRSEALPIPDNWSSCGDPNAPAHTITSPPYARRGADATVAIPASVRITNSAPVARVPSNRIRVVCAQVTTFRLGLDRTGCR
jgi:hypothetical protein